MPYINNVIEEKVFCLVSLKSLSNNFISLFLVMFEVSIVKYFSVYIFYSFYNFENLN